MGGPRPERPEIAADYQRELPEFELRLQVKAGLTGLAQVLGKYNTTPYVHEALGQINSTIISRAIQLIESGNTQALGELMDEAQRIFDLKVAPMCPEQLKAPVLHSLLQDSYIRTLIYGGKGVGSQGDGTIQFLAKDEE